MEKIIQYISNQTGSNFDDLQLFSAKYSVSEDTLKIIFSSPISDTYDDSKLEKLTKIVNDFVQNRCKTQVCVKQKSISKDFIETKLKELIKANPFYATIFDMDNSKISEQKGIFSITLPADKDGLTDFEQQKFEESFANISKLKQEQYSFTYVPFERKLASLDERLERFDDDADDVEPVKIQLLFNKIFLGNMESVNIAFLPEQIIEPLKNCYVAGEFANLSEHTKTTDDGRENKYYKFEITSPEGKINAISFLKLSSDLSKLKQGQKIVCYGDIDNFRGEYSIRVRGVSLCSFTFPEKKQRKVNKNYKFVKPEPYVQREQINFLDMGNKVNSKYLLDNTFVVFDLETTGLNYVNCKVIEIGAVKIVKGEITEVFSTFVNPQEHINDDATAKNNITDEMVKDAPTFNQVFPDFYKFIDGAVLVAHNISFDLPFLSHHAKPLGYVIANPTEDTLVLAQKYLWQLKHFNLAKVCEFLGVSLIGAHRAVNDTVATAKCFIKLIENYQNKENT